MNFELNVSVPRLEWKDFTDNHYSLKCHVHELNLIYAIHFNGTQEHIKGMKVQMFSVYLEGGKKPLLLASNECLSRAKDIAHDDYKMKVWEYLSAKANLFVFAVEHKEDVVPLPTPTPSSGVSIRNLT